MALPVLSDIEKILSSADLERKQKKPTYNGREKIKKIIKKRSSLNKAGKIKFQPPNKNIKFLHDESPIIDRKIQIYRAYNMFRSEFCSPKHSISPISSDFSSRQHSRQPTKNSLLNKLSMAIPFDALQKALKKHIREKKKSEKNLLVPVIPKLPFGARRDSQRIDQDKNGTFKLLQKGVEVDKIKRFSGRKKTRPMGSFRNSPVNQRRYSKFPHNYTFFK